MGQRQDSHHDRTSIPERRGRRKIKLSEKAQAIEEEGRILPGVSLPYHDTYIAQMPRRQQDRRAGPAPATNNSGIALPSFSQDSFAIYLWERPLPTNFLNLSDSQKTWKQRQDALEQESDTDDGADDWHEFSGVRTDYGRLSSNAFPMERCIASTFVNRAKRAFRAGQSWQQFENSELAIDSEGQARAEIDLRRRRLLLENALDNTLQLAVFDTIKQRLCEEIWLQAYQETATPAAVDTPNPSANTNSGASTWTTRIPMRPTPEESERGITGWLPNRYGDLEPLYEDETEIPGIGVRGRGRISENAGRVNGREGQ